MLQSPVSPPGPVKKTELLTFWFLLFWYNLLLIETKSDKELYIATLLVLTKQSRLFICGLWCVLVWQICSSKIFHTLHSSHLFSCVLSRNSDFTALCRIFPPNSASPSIMPSHKIKRHSNQDYKYPELPCTLTRRGDTMQVTAIIISILLASAQTRHRVVKQDRTRQGYGSIRGLQDKGANQQTRETKDDRRGKFFGIFNIVTFPNDICNGTNDLQG